MSFTQHWRDLSKDTREPGNKLRLKKELDLLKQLADSINSLRDSLVRVVRIRLSERHGQITIEEHSQLARILFSIDEWPIGR